jgi:hypothetical protein
MTHIDPQWNIHQSPHSHSTTFVGASFMVHTTVTSNTWLHPQDHGKHWPTDGAGSSGDTAEAHTRNHLIHHRRVQKQRQIYTKHPQNNGIQGAHHAAPTIDTSDGLFSTRIAPTEHPLHSWQDEDTLFAAFHPVTGA